MTVKFLFVIFFVIFFGGLYLFSQGQLGVVIDAGDTLTTIQNSAEIARPAVEFLTEQH